MMSNLCLWYRWIANIEKVDFTIEIGFRLVNKSYQFYLSTKMNLKKFHYNREKTNIIAMLVVNQNINIYNIK